MGYTNRIGTFLMLIGVLLIFLFVFSDIAGQPAYLYFFLGGLSLVLGAVLWWSSPKPPPPPSERFRSVKKMLSKEKKVRKP